MVMQNVVNETNAFSKVMDSISDVDTTDDMQQHYNFEGTVGKPLLATGKSRMTCRNVDIFYGDKKAINNVSIDIGKNEVLSMIGPSGCGKSTFLRSLNRMNDTIDICRMEGSIELDKENIYGKDIDVVPLRAQVGMVFQKPNPFPKSIYENVAYGLRIQGIKDRRTIDTVVEKSLRAGRITLSDKF